MKNIFFSFFLIMLHCISFGQIKPYDVQLRPWHTGTIKKIKFSDQGDYLITIDTDNNCIITDLKKRQSFTKIQLVSDDFLFVHDSENYFYVINQHPHLNNDSIHIEKRDITTGNVIQHVRIPKQYDGKRIGRANAYVNSHNEQIAVPYDNIYGSNEQVIVIFSMDGDILQTIKRKDTDQLNAIHYHNNKYYAVCSKQLWEQDGNTMNVALSSGNNNSFASVRTYKDTLIILSNKHLQWFHPKTGRVYRSIDISGFTTDSPYGNALLMRMNHPFEMDVDGNVWFSDTRLASKSNNAHTPYSLARIRDIIDYPLFSDKNYINNKRIEEFDISEQLFALQTSSLEIQVIDKNSRLILSLKPQQLQIENFYFTEAPGKIICVHHNNGYMINLGNSWVEEIFTVDKNSYSIASNKNSYYKGCEEITNKIKIYNASQFTFNQSSTLKCEKKNALCFPYKDPHYITSGYDTISWNANDDKIRWNSNGKKIKEIQIKGTENDFTKQYYFDKYYYDSVSCTLILCWGSQYMKDNVQHWIHVKSKKLLKTTQHQQILLNIKNQEYVTEQGIYKLSSDEPIKKFESIIHPEKIVHTSQSSTICYVTHNYQTASDDIYIYNSSKNVFKYIGSQSQIEQIKCDPHTDLIYTLGWDGIIKIWNPLLGKQIAELIINDDSEENDSKQVSMLIRLTDESYLGINSFENFFSSPSSSYSFFNYDNIFHRPDKVLQTLGYAQEETIKKLNEMANKRLERVNQSSNSVEVNITNRNEIPFYSDNNTIRIRAELKNNQQIPLKYNLYVNGVILWPTPKVLNQSIIEEHILLIDESNHIRVCILDSNNNEFGADYLYVNTTEIPLENLYLFGIGVSEYRDTTYNLKYAQKDAHDLISFFKTNNTYTKNNCIEISNQNATKKNIINALANFIQNASEKDQIIVFFAGHGLLDKKGNYYLAPHDMDFDYPEKNGLHIDELNNILLNSKVRKKIMLIDACHSGLMEDMVNIASTSSEEVIPEIATYRGAEDITDTISTSSYIYYLFSQFGWNNGIDILSASGANEYAWEKGDIANGVFTHNILSGIKKGMADLDKDGFIKIKELQHFVAKETIRMTQGKQRPAFRQSNAQQNTTLFKTDDSYTGKWFEAAQNNHVDDLEYLLKIGYVDINVKDANGFTALLYCAREGNYSAARFLLENGADVNMTSDFGFSNLFLAAFNSHPYLTYLLMQNGAKKEMLFDYQLKQIEDKKDPKTWYVLNNYETITSKEKTYAVFNRLITENKIDSMEIMYKRYKLDLNYLPYGDVLPSIFQALISNSNTSLEWLLRNGANPNLYTDRYDTTPLIISVFYDIENTKLLLRYGADKSIKNKMGYTALDYAKDKNKTDWILLLE